MENKANEKHKINIFGLRTLKIFEYKSFYVMIQQVGFIFQYIIFKDGVWRSSYIIDEDLKSKTCTKCKQPVGKRFYTNFELVRITQYVKDMAEATIDLILDPKGLVKKNQQAATIVDVLEKNEQLAQEEEKENIKKSKKVKKNA